MTAAPAFVLPADAEATAPPERRGIRRDDVRLLSASGGGVEHARFRDLPRLLRPGDLLVVNTSATLPAAVDGQRVDGQRVDGQRVDSHRVDGTPVVVHFSTPMGDAGRWLVEVRPAGRATGPVRDLAAGERLALAGGATAELVAPHPADVAAPRLWVARVQAERGVPAFLARNGRPIRYAYVPKRWPLTDYQTVFAHEPGSAEMPSAARPFTPELVTSLVARGVVLAPLTLHTGVSSLDAGEPPLPERFVVPAVTAELVNLTRAAGRDVIGVGTTVARALESVADSDGTVTPGEGWTDLVLGPDRPARVVTGLVTGWHAPGASHLSLLEAVAGRDLVATAYDEALRHGYLWHEFGDSCLLRPHG